MEDELLAVHFLFGFFLWDILCFAYALSTVSPLGGLIIM